MSESDDWAAMSHDARIDALVDLEARIAALHAAQYRLLAVMAADPPTTSLPGHADKEWLREDVACALRLSPGLAAARLAEAAELVRLPGTHDLLDRGAITLGHARAVLDATVHLDDATAAAVEARVLPRAPEQSVGTLRRAVHRAVLAVDSRTVEAARADAVSERRVCVRPRGNGTSELWALLPDEGAAAVMATITELGGSRIRGDERTADQRRADALVRLALDADLSTMSGGPVRHGLRPTVQVTVALSTLLRLDQQPGELAGVGPIPAELARSIAADSTGTWRRLVTDPTGRMIDYGRTTYRPPADLARHVVARDRTCRFPHCTRAAARSQFDHAIPWRSGGHTSADNMSALCSRHHHLRHDTGWTYSRDPSDDTATWQTQTGSTYVVEAAAYPTDATFAPDPPGGGADGAGGGEGDCGGTGGDGGDGGDRDPPPF